MVNMANGRTLGFIVDSDIKYSDVITGGENMAMMIRITGGIDVYLKPTFLIFNNQTRSYPICGLADTNPGVSYHTFSKGWMDYDV